MTPTVAVRRLERAGATLIALPARGCFPAAFPTACLSHLMPAEAEAQRFARPSAADVDAMDEAHGWVRLLPSGTRLDVQRRRLVLLRSLVWPDSEREDPHVWSWRRLSAKLGHDDKTLKRRHDVAIDIICARVNALPAPCRRMLERVAAHGRSDVAASAALVRELA